MDKRTLTFVFLTFASLFFVNQFFDYQSQEARKAHFQELSAKQKLKVKELDEEISARSVAPSTLPLVELFGDDKASTHLTTGIKDNGNILTIAWSAELPDTVYAKSTSTTDSYTLVSKPEAIGAPVVYQKGESKPLRLGYISDFGSYEMQLVTPSSSDIEHPYSVNVADYIDGSFSVPAEELAMLRHQMSENRTKSMPVSDQNSIALIKSNGSYLPVGIYIGAEKRFTPLQDNSSLLTIVVKPESKGIKAKGENVLETYYVLENGYQQVVFSNFGGAIVELNLPFESETNTKSVVKEIETDRDMAENHPYNARFPAHPYFSPGENTEGPYVENSKGQISGYYPLIRRDLIETGTRKSVKVPPKFYATNIVSEYPELAETPYTVKYFDKNKIVFESVQDRRRITKTYTLDNDIAPYCLTLSINCDGDCRGLWLTSGIPEVELISGAASPSLKYRITQGDKSEVRQITMPDEKSPLTIDSMSDSDWLSNSNGFFGLILDPLTPVDSGFRAQYVPGTVVPTRLVEVDQSYDRYSAQNFPGYNLLLPLKAKGGSMQFRLFAGPYSTPILKEVDAIYSNAETGYNPDYIACQTFHGWFAFISEPFAKFLFILLNFFYSITSSWALSIVLLTIALKVMTYPLNAWSTKAMARTQELMPKVQAIQQKYKSDPKKSQMEILNLYKEHGVNPISGMTGGCFPLLIQMPFLIGMFDLLKSSFQLRGASFIPGWIDNLSSPDVLFSWSYPIPLIGTEFHLLPIILGVIMFIQPRIMSPMPEDKSQWTEQQRQQRTMSTVMAVMFTWLFYNFPSGLNIYWISSMVLGIVQQWWNKKQIKPIAPSTDIEVQGKKSNVKTKKGSTGV